VRIADSRAIRVATLGVPRRKETDVNERNRDFATVIGVAECPGGIIFLDLGLRPRRRGEFRRSVISPAVAQPTVGPKSKSGSYSKLFAAA